MSILNHESRRYNAATQAWEFDADKAREHFADAKVGADGTVRWASNDRIPFRGMLFDFFTLGLITFEQMELSCAVRRIEDEAAIEAYRQARANRTPEQRAEELFEMRAAFGAGERVVNVLTGEVTQL